MLNQDQEKRAVLEAGAVVGMVKLYVLDRGQPPMMDLMTLKVRPLSYESES